MTACCACFQVLELRVLYVSAAALRPDALERALRLLRERSGARLVLHIGSAQQVSGVLCACTCCYAR